MVLLMSGAVREERGLPAWDLGLLEGGKEGLLVDACLDRR